LLDLILVASKYLYLISGTLTIGFLLALTFFAENKNGIILDRFLVTKRKIRVLALTWSVSTFIYIFATLAEILELSFVQALDLTSLRSFLTQITLGKFLLAQALGALAVAIAISAIKRVTYLSLLLIISLMSITWPIFESHSAASGSHLMAIGTLIVHVLAISLWVGGLSAIILNKELDRMVALRRFAPLAKWAAASVILSGAINGWLRMNFADAWSSNYAKLLVGKLFLTSVLLLIANTVRIRFQKKSDIGVLIRFETLLLFLIILVGTLLSRSVPPIRDTVIDPIEELVGLKYPGNPNLATWLFAYQPDALTLAVLILTTLLYINGVRVLHRRGDHWPTGRTISFLIGILIINYAINGAIGIYAHFGFSYHMIEHMILGMIAPIPIVLSAPITLALRTLPAGNSSDDEGIRNILIRALHSRYAKVITNPVIALLIFDGSLFALYFTGLFGDLMGNHLGHLAMNFHFLMAGILFFHVIVGVDPNPNRPPNVVRIVILFGAMSIHAFFSIALMSATTLLDGGYYASIGNPMNLDLLENQYAGGAIGWAMGEIPILIALAAAFIQWMRDDSKESKRIDRNAARASAMGEADDLKKYNDYLAELARKDENL
jgi:putative copper resistance protein D